MEKVLKDHKLFHRFNVFPIPVKEAFSFTTSADYNHEQLKIQCEDEGDKGYDNFYILFRSTCSKGKYSDFIKKFKDHLPENPKIEDIQEHWDQLVTVDGTVAQDHDCSGLSSQMTPPLSQALTTDGLFFVQLNTLISNTN